MPGVPSARRLPTPAALVARALVARALAAGALSLAPTPAAAQLGIFEAAFESFSDVNVFGIAAGFARRPGELTGGDPDDEPRAWGLYGFGVEASFYLAGLGRQGAPPPPIVRMDTVEIRTEQVAGRPATTSYVVRPHTEQPEAPPLYSAELALGYAEVTGFRSVTPGADIRGSFRELPSLALYLSYEPPELWSYYVGVRSGLAQLHGFRAYVGEDDGDPDIVYTAAGTAFQAGVALGGTASAGPLTFFVEPSYTFRKFSGVEWDAVDDRVDDALPRALDLSTWAVSFGVQFQLGRK